MFDPTKKASERTLEELEEIMNGPPERIHEIARTATESSVEPTEPEPQPEPDASAETAVTVPAPEPPPAPAHDQEDLDRQILAARVEELTAEVARQEKMIGRQAGEIGFKQQQRIRELEAQIQRLQESRQPDGEDTGYSGTEMPAEPKQHRAAPPTRDALSAWAVGQAVSQAGAGFFQSYPEAKDLAGDMKAYLEASGKDLSGPLEMDDPIEAARQTTNLFEEALQHVKAERSRALRKELEAKRADQIRGLEDAKRRAASSGAGAPPPPKPPEKPASQMTLAEAEAKLKEYDQIYGRRRR